MRTDRRTSPRIGPLVGSLGLLALTAGVSIGIWWLAGRGVQGPTHVLGVHQTQPTREQLSALERAANQQPQDPMAQLRLGSAFLTTGDFTPGLDRMRRAAAHPQTAGIAAQALEEFARDHQRYADIAGATEQAVKVAPNDARAWEAYIRTLFALGQYETARATLGLALRRMPEETRFRFILAEITDAAGNGLEATRIYEAALKQLPDARAQLSYGLLLGRMRGWQTARRALLQAVALNPRAANAHIGLAKAELELGLVAEAEQSAYSALRIDPQEPEAIHLLGIVFAGRGTPSDARTARELFERVLVLRPQHPDARYRLGVLKLNAGEARAAVRDLEEVLRTHPDRLEARQAYARALRQAGDIPAATEQDRLAVQIAEMEQKRGELTTRVSQRPQDVEARLKLAEFYLEHNAAPLAERQYLRALEIEPKNPRAMQGLERAR